jgi:hypothetical protein
VRDLSKKIDDSLLPSWVLGTFLPLAVVDGVCRVGMVSIRELRERMVFAKIRVGGWSERRNGKVERDPTRIVSARVDKNYIERSDSLASWVGSKAGLPVISLPNFREWVRFRFSLSPETFLLGLDILAYCRAMSRDDLVGYVSMSDPELEKFRIRAGSGDIAYFSAWVMENVWKAPTYLILGKFPEEKVFCITNIAGWWNFIFSRGKKGYVEDEKFESVPELVTWLRSKGAESVAFSRFPLDGDDLVWLPYEESYFEELAHST